MNCLTKKSWFRNQIPIWWFSERELKTNFDLESRRYHPAIFPTALAQRVIKNYTHPGQTVMDCFCGIGTTLYSAQHTARNAIGIELNSKYVEFAEQRLSKPGIDIDNEKALRTQEGVKIRAIPTTRQVQICDDARNLLKYIPQHTIDLVLCSPPYWDLLKQKPSERNIRKNQYLKKNYSDDPNDLSNERELEGFVNALRDIISKAIITLKYSGRFIIITGDYRRRGRFIPLHEIYLQLFSDLGCELRNIIIWDRRKEYDTSLFSYPYNFIVNNGMYEYILEFQKKKSRKL